MKEIKFYNLPLKNRKFEKKFIDSFKKINSKGRYIIGKYVEIFENNFAKFPDQSIALLLPMVLMH